MKKKQLLMTVGVLLATCATELAQGQGQTAAGPSINVAAQIDANIVAGASDEVSGTTKLYLKAQLVQNLSNTPPFTQVVLTLASFLVTPAAGSPGYTQACALTNSSTMLECTLTPSPGPGWSNSNPVSLSVQLTSASGHIATDLVTYGAGPAPTLQVNVVSGGGPGTPLHLTAQMVQNINNTAPFNQVPLELRSLALTGSPLTKAAGSPAFSQSCSLTNSNTMLECPLTPSPGPGWSNSNPLTLRVRLTSVSGQVATSLVTFGGGPGPTVQTQLQAGNQFPTTANAAPIYLVAQLVRPVIVHSPVAQSPLELAALSSQTVTPATLSQGFVAFPPCSLTNSSTMFECKLTPFPGPNWVAGGPLVIRVRLVAADGGAATTLLQFRIVDP